MNVNFIKVALGRLASSSPSLRCLHLSVWVLGDQFKVCAIFIPKLQTVVAGHYIFWLSVCLSHSCEHNICWKPLEGNFFKFGTNVCLDSRMNLFWWNQTWDSAAKDILAHMLCILTAQPLRHLISVVSVCHAGLAGYSRSSRVFCECSICQLAIHQKCTVARNFKQLTQNEHF